MRRTTIRTRLFATFALMCILMGLMGGASLWATTMQRRAFNAFVDGVVGSLQQAGELCIAIVNVRRHESEVYLALGQPQEAERHIRAWQEQVDGADHLATALTQRIKHS